MRYPRLCFYATLVCLFYCFETITGQETIDLKSFADSARKAAGKPDFLPLGTRFLELAKEQKDTTQIADAYACIASHYYDLGNIDSLRLITYEYMDWADRCHRNTDRYQAWRQYIQRMTEKGMQEEAMRETELLSKDAEKRKDKYGMASGEMCIGYNHRIFGQNVKLCLEYYDNALKHFEEGKYYRDAYVVSLNIIQTYLARQAYADALPYLDRLEQLKKATENKNYGIGAALHMRYYQFRVIGALGTKGKAAAESYVKEADAYYRKHKEDISPEGWFGYKLMCSQILGDIRTAVSYMDSLIDYQNSLGNYYPGNYRQKAIMLEQIGNYKEACHAFAEYAQLNDSIRTAEMDEQLNKYTAQFEVDRLKMEKLELSDKMNRERLIIVFTAGCVILILLLLVTYLYVRTLSMNRKLDSAHKEIQKMSRIKSSFIQHVTHELRTPLNSVVGFSALLAEEGLNAEEAREYSDQVEKNSSYLLGLIDNIIDIADMDSQTADMPKEAIDVNACCLECIDAFGGKQKEGVEIQWIPSPETPVVLTVRAWMKRVLSLLLDNAAKFTEKGVICLRCEEDKAHGVVRFILEDTGIGIDSQYRDTVFERFFKVDTFTPGTGLGLSIARQVMDIVDGKIYLDADYTQGTRVIVEWPINSNH
ncbi:ATP-binding protein [uncultured Bacteroides sp.]|uniref:ATP-binding protein n=1 Tax=uncultured Bacteroides sp. TaxID=162156 RepID=UPI0025F2B4EF|nr:ATP-binding protein [uncultured Bacteroides sp.]